MFCPNCKSRAIKLRYDSADYNRGMNYFCKKCDAFLLLIFEPRGGLE
jgi:predicted SprT family Zn-dependent metalloprotease